MSESKAKYTTKRKAVGDLLHELLDGSGLDVELDYTGEHMQVNGWITLGDLKAIGAAWEIAQRAVQGTAQAINKES